jgi:mono/diheme cytochrome c family protein
MFARVSLPAGVLLLLGAVTPAFASAQPPTPAVRAGAAVYESACAACHGHDGKGVAREAAGHAWPLPDFTDCRFASPERRDDWTIVIREGGPVRAFSRAMPAFGDALSSAEIAAAISHLRTFCAAPRWPVGDLNLPRPLATEKAFPENEAVVTFAVPLRDRDNAEARLIYERRIGSRGQVEADIPFATRKINGNWHRGLGDVEAGYKHVLMARAGTIVSGSASLTLPSGKEQYGLGTRLTVFEPSALVGQRLTNRLFAHGQFGLELPLNIASTPNEVFWRAAAGATFNGASAGRAWTPMIELSGHREFEYRDPIRWDLLPQLQVTLSRRQHIKATAGARVPIGGPSRPQIALLALTWDWLDGGLLSGW